MRFVAGIGETVDQPVPHWIVRVEEDDGCLRFDRRLLRSLDGPVFEGDDEIDSLADEHLRLVLGLRLVQIPPHEPDALALEVAALPLLLQAALDDGIREIPPECLLELQGQAVERARDVIQTDVHQADASVRPARPTRSSFELAQAASAPATSTAPPSAASETTSKRVRLRSGSSGIGVVLLSVLRVSHSTRARDDVHILNEPASSPTTVRRVGTCAYQACLLREWC